MAYIQYCPFCHDVSLSETCPKCHRLVVRIEGSIEEFRQVLQALANNQKDWFILLESMQKTHPTSAEENLSEPNNLPDQ